MSLPSFIKNKPPSEAAAEIELDLTPMMSMFLILLPFLVSMAVLTHLTILEFSLPPNVGAAAAAGPSSEKPRLKLTIVITPEYLLMTHGERLLDSIPHVNGSYGFDQVTELLRKYKQELNLENELVVASRDQVRLKNIVTLMDRCKAAGFEKIGLSSATADPGEGK
jgi:biopolymer transport protein ExbD